MSFKLGVREKVDVCRQSFRFAYGISRDFLNTLAKDVKTLRINDQRPFNDRSNPSRDEALESYCRDMDIELGFRQTPDQRAASRIPNSPEALECWAWMKKYFDLVGDFQPNSDGEIHLDACTIKDVWKAYVHDQTAANKSSYFQHRQFCDLWVTCFE